MEEHKKLVEKIIKRDEKRRKRIEAAGIDYECPEIVRILLFSLLLALFCTSENGQSLGMLRLKVNETFSITTLVFDSLA